MRRATGATRQFAVSALTAALFVACAIDAEPTARPFDDARAPDKQADVDARGDSGQEPDTSKSSGPADGGPAPVGEAPVSPEAAVPARPSAMLFVDGATGRDSNPGTSALPFATIQRGIDVAAPGQIVEVRDGVYHETVTISAKATDAQHPIWLRAAHPGKATISACLPDARAGKTSWRDEGDGLYSIAHGDDVLMAHHAEDSSFLPRLKSKADLQSGSLATSSGKIQVPPYGVAFEGGRIWLRLADGGSPAGQQLRIPQAWKTKLVRISATPYLILDGFTLECGGEGYAVTADSASHHLTVRNCVFELSRIGITVPDDAIIEWNEYAYPGFKEWAEAVRKANGSPPSAIHVFDYVKRYNNLGGNAYYEGGLCESASGQAPERGVELRYNYYHDNFDGERFGTFEDSDLHHNVFQHCLDNAYQAESWRGGAYRGRKLRIHENLFLDGLGSPLSHQDGTGAMAGPHYVYRNVIHDSDPVFGRGAIIVKNQGLAAQGCQVYLYYNVLQSLNGFDHNSAAVAWGGTDRLYRTAGGDDPQYLHFRNNAIIFEGGSTGHKAAPAGDSDYNVVVDGARDEGALRGAHGQRLTSVAPLGFVAYGTDFTPSPGSPLHGAAGPLPATWQAPDAPGFATTDVGCFQQQTPQPANWPRPYSRSKHHFSNDVPERWP